MCTRDILDWIDKGAPRFVWQLEAEIIEMMVMKEDEESQCKNVCVDRKAAGVGNKSM